MKLSPISIILYEPLRLRILRIIDLGVHSGFWHIIDPFSHEDLILCREEVTSLTLSLVVDPVAFKVIAVAPSALNQ
jgi:hypothetical protein